MKPWSIVKALPEHIPAIAAHMRDADRREVWAYRRHTPEQSLRFSLSRSLVAWTGIIDGSPAVMWGVGGVSLLSLAGSPWLLGTDAVRDVTGPFLRHSRLYVRKMQDAYPRLENHVHAANTLSIRWLRWCGFTIDDAPEESNGEDFFLFWREAACVSQ
jgi:hypothetical protein